MNTRRLWSKFLCCGVAMLAGASAADAQTNPTPRAIPFAEDFGSVASTTPPLGFSNWNGISGGSITTQAAAEGSSPPSDGAILTTTPSNGGTGGARYYAVGSDARLGVLQSSNATNGVHQWVLGIDTTGATTATIAYDLSTNIGNTRPAGVVLQYRVGTTGAWTSFSGSEYLAMTGAAPQSFNLAIPSAALNSPNVQIRWANWRPTGSGNSSGFDLDNLSVTTGIAQATGACCLATGQCTVTTMAACTSSGGTYQGDSITCMEANCPVPMGSCCVGIFCQVTTATACASVMGVFNANDPNCSQACVELTGACCLQDGMCQILSATDCGSAGGIYAGDGTDCMNRPCLFTCCFNDGSCQLLSLNDCGTAGGIANSARTTCSPSNCPQPTTFGACCVGTVCTMSVTWADCTAQSGVWLGSGTTCTAMVCEQASSPTLVAKYDFDVNRQGTLMITTDGMAPFPGGDAFGVVQALRLDPEPEPFALVDQSTGVFATDVQGFLGVSKVDSVFGVADTFDIIATGTNEAMAEWAFNVAGRTNLSLSVQIAGMGNFEVAGVADRFILEIALDADPFVVVFEARADEAVSATYTMDSGAMVTIDDPLRDMISGNLVDDTFATYTFPVAGAGSTLRFRLRAAADGGSDEGFAIDNIMVMADAIVTTPMGACCSGNGCQVASQDLCENTLGGTYQGDMTGCDPDPCAAAPCPGDYNNDGQVDLLDLLAFNGEWSGNLGTMVPMGTLGDYDGSGTVDLLDLLSFNGDWSSNLGTPCP